VFTSGEGVVRGHVANVGEDNPAMGPMWIPTEDYSALALADDLRYRSIFYRNKILSYRKENFF
jgi:hypothetical protein